MYWSSLYAHWLRKSRKITGIYHYEDDYQPEEWELLTNHPHSQWWLPPSWQRPFRSAAWWPSAPLSSCSFASSLHFVFPFQFHQVSRPIWLYQSAFCIAQAPLLRTRRRRNCWRNHWSFRCPNCRKNWKIQIQIQIRTRIQTQTRSWIQTQTRSRTRTLLQTRPLQIPLRPQNLPHRYSIHHQSLHQSLRRTRSCRWSSQSRCYRFHHSSLHRNHNLQTDQIHCSLPHSQQEGSRGRRSLHCGELQERSSSTKLSQSASNLQKKHTFCFSLVRAMARGFFMPFKVFLSTPLTPSSTKTIRRRKRVGYS